MAVAPSPTNLLWNGTCPWLVYLDPKGITGTFIPVANVLSFRLFEPIPVGAGCVISLCMLSFRVEMAVALADLRLLLKRPTFGGEVERVGASGGEWLFEALDKEKKDPTRLVGETGGTWSED